ncbi:MAG: tetratricopeptide repeat protein [Leptolyngbya sp. DLM2.Bin27]|nr:MAG: tetratricopeptide repeat protein [Leptolyngbya sp. DLM2.Bin27]
MRLELNPISQAIADWLERHGQLEKARSLYLNLTASLAIGGLQAAIGLFPKSARYHEYLAQALAQQGRYQEAIAACDKALMYDADLASVHYTRGKALQAQGLWEEAVQAFRHAIDLDGKVAWFHYGLGKAHMSRENWDLAIEALQVSHKLAPEEFWICYGLGEALVKGGYFNEAISALERAISLQASFPWAYYYLGDAYLAEERLEEAITVYREAGVLRPSNPYIGQSLDYALHLQQQDEKLEHYCQRLRSQPLALNDDKLNILMITPYAPYPPQRGAIARMFYELKLLGQHHRVVLVSLMFSKDEYKYEAELENYCDLAILTALGDSPICRPHTAKIVNRYSSKRLRTILSRLQAISFEIVSYNFVYTAQYREFFPHAFNILAEHNIESELLKRSAEIQSSQVLISQLAVQTDSVKSFVAADTEAQLLEAYENKVWGKFPLRTVVSDREKQILDGRCPTGQTLVVNNGVDTQSISLLPLSPHKRMLFIGTMGYFPNIDAVTYCAAVILPYIWQLDPDIEFWIAGATPPKAVLDLAEDPRITVIADPENMTDVARECRMSIVPLRFGGGTRIKILHAMAMGLPMVSTSLGCEGLEVKHGTHLLIQDEPVHFAQSAVRLMEDSCLQQSLRQNGRQLVEQRYDWNTIYTDAEKEYAACYRQWRESQVKEQAPS